VRRNSVVITNAIKEICIVLKICKGEFRFSSNSSLERHALKISHFEIGRVFTDLVEASVVSVLLPCFWRLLCIILLLLVDWKNSTNFLVE
jgi:hypothetical protein